MSDYLFAEPSVMEGIGRTIDLFGVMNAYNYSINGEDADQVAIENDITILHSDLMDSFQEVVRGYSR